MRNNQEINLQVLLQINTRQSIGQCRTLPVRLGSANPRAFLAKYCADFDVDPFIEMFFYPNPDKPEPKRF